jgi:uncharacterized membrane protein YjdF
MRPIVVLLALLAFTSPAFAYVDPGTGMLAIQGLIALVIGVLAFVQHPFQTIGRWWRRWTGKGKDSDDA